MGIVQYRKRQKAPATTTRIKMFADLRRIGNASARRGTSEPMRADNSLTPVLLRTSSSLEFGTG